MEAAIFLLTMSVLFGIADYTITRIILKGSIFEGLRNWIKYSEMTKLKQLFGCHLCLGAEISLWFISFPLHYFSGSPFAYFISGELTFLGSIIFNLGSWFLFAMVITGIHYWLWANTVDRPVPANQPISVIVDQKTKPGKELSFEGQNYNNGKITLEEFTMLAFYVHYSCGSIQCPFERPERIKNTVDVFIKGKIMRAMNLIGFGKIPERIHMQLLRKLHQVMDSAIDTFRSRNIDIGSGEWIEEIKRLYQRNEISEIDFLS